MVHLPEDAEITSSGLTEAVGVVNPSKIHGSVDRLKEAGLLKELPGGGRGKPLVRLDSGVWAWVLEYDTGDDG